MSKELRRFDLDGYSKYQIQEDGTVINKSTGKLVKADKNGQIKIKSDSGEEYSATQQEYLDIIKDQIEPVAESDLDEIDDSPEAEAEKEEATDAEKLKEERKRLVKAIAEATKKMLKCKVEEIPAAKAEYDAADAALDAFKLANSGKSEKQKKEKKERVKKEVVPDEPPTAEQIAAQEAYDAAKKSFEDAKEALKLAEVELKKFKKIRVANSGAGGGDHTKKIDYRMAQQIRKMLSEGKTHGDCTEMFGNSTASVGYIKNYLQHKLRRAPEGADMTEEENMLLYTAWLPLVNDFYPAKWMSKDGVECSGAPYVEDKIKEDNNRYKLGNYPDLSKEEVVSELD